MGNRLALLCDAPVPRILDAYARQGAVRRDMVARDEARGRNLPRAAAQGRTRTVQIPAPRAPAVGPSDARRLWPADEEERADPHRSGERRVGARCVVQSKSRGW